MAFLLKSLAVIQHGQVRFMSNGCNLKQRCKLLIIGGGTGGCSVAWRLAKTVGAHEIIVLDPSPKHFYQPQFALVGAGLRKLKDASRPLPSVLPPNVTWIQDAAAAFDPDLNLVHTCKNATIKYEYMVVAAGIMNNYDTICGLQNALDDPYSAVSSIYSPKYCKKTWCDIKNLKGGLAIFTFPRQTVKCPGAAQKIMYFAEHYFRKNKTRPHINIVYMNGRERLFGIDKYEKTLVQVCCKRNIPYNCFWELTEVGKKKALFSNGDKQIILPFSMLHVTPPMTPPAALARSPLADQHGYLSVDAHTLQHTLYCNVFGVGDCTNTPNGKTAGAIGPQSAVLERNLISAMHGRVLSAKYVGYSVCPIATCYGKAIMAEFGYDKKPMETFPFDQSKESRILYYLITRRIPKLYWNKLVKGKWDGPHNLRKRFKGTEKNTDNETKKSNIS